MPSPRVATKLHLPKPRPDLVARPRLATLLDRGAKAKLTLVSAPTGFGKTSLVSQWLSSRTTQDRTVVWIALDPADDQPVAFWAQVLTALQAAALPAIGKSILPLLESGQPPTEGVLAVVVNELSALPDGLDLVLDEQLKRESDRARTTVRVKCSIAAQVRHGGYFGDGPGTPRTNLGGQVLAPLNPPQSARSRSFLERDLPRAAA